MILMNFVFIHVLFVTDCTKKLRFKQRISHMHFITSKKLDLKHPLLEHVLSSIKQKVIGNTLYLL